MGLDILVGVLAEVKTYPDLRFEGWLDQQFEAINQALREAGLPEHREPLDVGPELPFFLDMWSYGGLHDLRRLAAHHWTGRALPEPSQGVATKDPVLEEFYDHDELAAKPNGFPHLIYHSDCDGFYLPIPFESVIFADPALGVAGNMIGSTYALMLECLKLAEVLDLPLDLDPESEEFNQAIEYPGEPLWQRYGPESFTCLGLYEGARLSVESGCLLLFT